MGASVGVLVGAAVVGDAVGKACAMRGNEERAKPLYEQTNKKKTERRVKLKGKTKQMPHDSISAVHTQCSLVTPLNAPVHSPSARPWAQESGTRSARPATEHAY